MASKKLVKALVTTFLTMTSRKMSSGEIETLANAYEASFKYYTDKQIQVASQKYIEEGEFFPPKPKEIIDRIPDAGQDKHTRELVTRYTCSHCHQKVSAISNGVCLDCLGIPPVSYEHIKPWPDYEKPNYKIEGRMRCSKCGSMGMAIKEPANSGNWLCRLCYSGMTGVEISNAWKQLGNMIGDAE